MMLVSFNVSHTLLWSAVFLFTPKYVFMTIWLITITFNANICALLSQDEQFDAIDTIVTRTVISEQPAGQIPISLSCVYW